VHFIHLNNTNAARNPDSPEANRVHEAGFNIARLLQIESL